MSEVQSRPAAASRGRGSGRGGRGGGHSIRGGSRIASRTAAPNGDSNKHDTDSALPTLEDEGEVGQLKKQYGAKVGLIKEIVPDWSEVDILFALRETDGDENLAVSRIAEGTIAQWGEVSKPKKERARPKGKNDTFTTTTADSAPGGAVRPVRGGRTGVEGGRGRGRATERGSRGGARGKSTVATNGTRAKDSSQLSVPTEESSEWNSKPAADEWDSPVPEATPAEPAPSAPVVAPKPAVTPENAPKTWASMLRQSTAAKTAANKPKEAPVPKPTEPTIEPLPPAEPEPVEPDVPEVEEEPAPEAEEEVAPPTVEVPTVVVPEVALPPSKDQLTETNLEQIDDASHPAPEGTARSEATDSWDPRAQAPSATATPLSASQQQHQPNRTPVSGYAATATKATERAATRTPSHTRRILEQREAVRMPGNRDQVDRAAVQFGAFSLNGDEDIDGDREEPETRPQPPEDSPVAHPRTSLPPTQPAPVPEAFPPQKQAAPVPPTGPAASTPTVTQAVAPSAPSQAVQPPTAPSAQQYSRFGQPAPQEPPSFPASKPFDAFPQQQVSASGAQSQFEGGFPSQAQTAQSQAQQPAGAFSSASNEFSSYYTADSQSRNAYNSYYNNQNFGQQQAAQGQQDSLSTQPQRSFSGYNAGQADSLSQYPQSGVQHAQSARFGSNAGPDTQTVATPTPGQSVAPGAAAQATQTQSHGQQQPHDYPYNHPYYNNPYYSGYMGYNQGGYSAGGYGGPYGGKGGLGYQPTQYGMTPQGPHGYGSSPAAGFGQSALHRETGVGAGLGDYSRAGPGQSAQQGLGSSGFGGMHDAFGRSASAYQSQSGQSYNAAGPQPGSGPSGDELKPFGDSKPTSGPSPSLGAAARPGSAANNAPSQAGLPPPQSNQQGLSGIGGYGYPGHLQGHGLHGSQSGAGGYGMSASGAQGQGQGHQNSYGGYGGQGFSGGNYYSQNPPRPWGNNYH